MTAPWRHRTGCPSTVASTSTLGPGPLDERGPDEHGVERPAVEVVDGEVGLEGVDLAAEGVAAHDDVDGAEAALVGPAVEDLGAEEDHPGAGAEGRQPVGQALGQRVEQPGRLEQHRHRGATRRRAGPARRPRRARPGVRTSTRLSAEGRAGTRRARAKAPCRASTPTFTWGPR